MCTPVLTYSQHSILKCDPAVYKICTPLFWTFYSTRETNQTSGVTAYRAVKRGDCADLSVPDRNISRLKARHRYTRIYCLNSWLIRKRRTQISIHWLRGNKIKFTSCFVFSFVREHKTEMYSWIRHLVHNSFTEKNVEYRRSITSRS